MQTNWTVGVVRASGGRQNDRASDAANHSAPTPPPPTPHQPLLLYIFPRHPPPPPMWSRFGQSLYQPLVTTPLLRLRVQRGLRESQFLICSLLMFHTSLLSMRASPPPPSSHRLNQRLLVWLTPYMVCPRFTPLSHSSGAV